MAIKRVWNGVLYLIGRTLIKLKIVLHIPNRFIIWTTERKRETNIRDKNRVKDRKKMTNEIQVREKKREMMRMLRRLW